MTEYDIFVSSPWADMKYYDTIEAGSADQAMNKAEKDMLDGVDVGEFVMGFFNLSPSIEPDEMTVHAVPSSHHHTKRV